MNIYLRGSIISLLYIHTHAHTHTHSSKAQRGHIPPQAETATWWKLNDRLETAILFPKNVCKKLSYTGIWKRSKSLLIYFNPPKIFIKSVL